MALEMKNHAGQADQHGRSADKEAENFPYQLTALPRDKASNQRNRCNRREEKRHVLCPDTKLIHRVRQVNVKREESEIGNYEQLDPDLRTRPPAFIFRGHALSSVPRPLPAAGPSSAT